MQLVVKDVETIRMDAEPRMNDDQFYEFCMANSNLRIERTAGGKILIMPPAGGETGYRNTDLLRQLGNWALSDKRGRAFDSNTEFLLPTGAAFAPDAAWVLKSRLDALTREQKRKFPPLCPDFIVELTSPTDRLKQVKKKMEHWIESGAKLGWLIDADRRTAYIYRPGREPETLTGINKLSGEDPVAGFELDLTYIWEGL